jgi:transcriptional regulator with XRE-family HTH domain
MNAALLNWPTLVEEAIRRRKAEGLSQRALAALAGVSVPTVNAFEKGSTKLRFDGVVAILSVLGLYDSPIDPTGLEAFMAEGRAAAEKASLVPSYGFTEMAFEIEPEQIETLGAAALKQLAREFPPLENTALSASLSAGGLAYAATATGQQLRYFALDKKGRAYALAGYLEDGPPSLKFGTLFDICLPILSAADQLRLAAAAARAGNGDERAGIEVLIRFSGLAGRTLVAWSDPLLAVDAGGMARTDMIECRLRTDVERIEQHLAEAIAELLGPLYERFDGFIITPEFVAEQLGISAQREGVSTGPFAVTKEMIAGLGDEDLRTLVGKLLEAEASARGIGVEAIGLGGNQTARDGGIDAIISWRGSPAPSGHLPARTIFFQCKATAMRPADIGKEMRPDGVLRPIFPELASKQGAYLIASTDDPGTKAIEARVAAMRQAVADIPHAERIHLDFLGSDRLARWTNQHVGVALWLLARAGRPLVGWRPHGPWSGAEAGGHGYLFDEIDRAEVNGDTQSVRAAITAMRAALSLPRSAVRIVGMSGMGKTRLAEALFDRRIPAGSALNPSLAIYADAGLELATGGAAMAEHLARSGIEAVLVFDNCAAAAHRQLASIVALEGSRTRLLTIDYDVGDEQPEATLVVKLERNSEGLLGDLLKQRAPAIGEYERARLAEFAGGNARIALGIARGSGALDDNELLDRLFQRGRGQEDRETRRAAEAAALVWAFYIEPWEEQAAEHLVLAAQCGMSAERFYEHMSVLLDWGVVQQRGPQRAVMPPPLANRLAASYLARADLNALSERFAAGPLRLCHSLARRLGQLHDQPKAVSLLQSMMAEGGMLGDYADLDQDGRRAFAHAAPGNAVAALGVLERAVRNEHFVANDDGAADAARILAHIAYEPALFDRALRAMVPLALVEGRGHLDQNIRDLFMERFRPVLSMTLADGPTRIATIDALVADPDGRVRSLGLAAIGYMLDVHAHSSFDPEWGAQRRYREWQPRTPADRKLWFEGAFSRLQSVVDAGGEEGERARDMIAADLRAFCDRGLADEIVTAVRAAKPNGYWDAAWRAAVETLHFSNGTPEPAWRATIVELERSLRPKTLDEAFEAFVLGAPWRHWVPQNRGEKRYTRDVALLAKAVGACLMRQGIDMRPYIARAVAIHEQNSSLSFGEGLAREHPDPDGLWRKARDIYLQAQPASRDVGVVIGILQQVDRRDRAWADARLDEIADDPVLAPFLVFFHGGRDLGVADVDRFAIALGANRVTAAQLGALMYGSRTRPVPAAALAGLLLRMIEHDGGLDAAREILAMRFYGDRQDGREIAPELVAVARRILTDARLYAERRRAGHEAATLLRHLLDREGESGARAVCAAMREADGEHKYWSDSDWREFAVLMASRFPRVILDEFSIDAPGGRTRRRHASLLSLFLGGSIANDVDGRDPDGRLDPDVLIEWAELAAEERAPLLAEHVAYAEKDAERDGEDDNLGWSEIALRLIDIAPDPGAVLDQFENRFFSGVSSGPFWLRFERRRPMIEELRGHRDRRVRQWASEAIGRLDAEIGYWKDRESERESLFE